MCAAICPSAHRVPRRGDSDVSSGAAAAAAAGLRAPPASWSPRRSAAACQTPAASEDGALVQGLQLRFFTHDEIYGRRREGEGKSYSARAWPGWPLEGGRCLAQAAASSARQHSYGGAQAGRLGARQGQAHNLLRGMGVDGDWLELGKLQGAEDALEEDDRKDVGGVEAREAASLRCGAHIQLRASVHRQLRRRQRAGWLLVMLVSVGMCNAASLLLFLCSHALKGFAVCIPAA